MHRAHERSRAWQSWVSPSQTLSHKRLTPRHVLREIALVLLLSGAYFLTRGLIRGREIDARANARSLLAFEKALHLDPEMSLQSMVLHHTWLMQAANFFYLGGHLPALLAIAVWLYLKRPLAYTWFRNAFLISAAFGLSIYVWLPMAPPRYMPGFVDTMASTGQGLDGSAVGLLYNPYAAMPSLHVGWSLLAGLVLLLSTRAWWLKLLGAALPLCMAVTVIVTGNHYLLDIVAGVAITLLSLALSMWWLTFRQTRSLPHVVPQRAPDPATKVSDEPTVIDGVIAGVNREDASMVSAVAMRSLHSTLPTPPDGSMFISCQQINLDDPEQPNTSVV